jgi:hypothetical protein
MHIRFKLIETLSQEEHITLRSNSQNLFADVAVSLQQASEQPR